MASTQGSTRADPRFDGGVAPTVAKAPFTGVEEALARLAHQAASDTPDARPRGPASDRSAEALAVATLGPADLRAPIPREQRLLGRRGTLARAAIAFCLGATAIWAWHQHGGPARDMIATRARPLGWISARPSADQTPAPQTLDLAPDQAAAPPAVETSAPPPAQAASQAASIAQPATTAANEPGAASAERQQIETMARDLATLRQTVEQLAAGQEQLTRKIAKKPQAEEPKAEQPDKRMLHRVSAQDAPTVAAPSRKPAPITPMPPQAARRVSTVTALSRPPRPAPQMPSETQPSNPPPLRPPMPVPQP